MNIIDYTKCLELLREFVEVVGPEKCHRDHHGYCQTHFLQKDCIVDKSRKQLEKVNQQILESIK